MGNENLETVIEVEQGGGVTIFSLRDHEQRYLTISPVHLETGYQVRILREGEAKLGKEPTIYIRIKEMSIHPDPRTKFSYVEKTVACIELKD